MPTLRKGVPGSPSWSFDAPWGRRSAAAEPAAEDAGQVERGRAALRRLGGLGPFDEDLVDALLRRDARAAFAHQLPVGRVDGQRAHDARRPGELLYRRPLHHFA